MAKIERFEDLGIWKDAIEIVTRIYILIENENIKNDYRMRDQLTGAAISISNNIAEGFEYNNTKQFIRYLRMAKGSAGEVRNLLFILLKTKKIEVNIYNEYQAELLTFSKKIGGFIKYLTGFLKSVSPV